MAAAAAAAAATAAATTAATTVVPVGGGYDDAPLRLAPPGALAGVLHAALATARDMWVPAVSGRDAATGAALIGRVSARGLTPERFMREYVARNIPVIITDALEAWPATKLWSPEFLREHYGDTPVTINTTPDGWGDALLPPHAAAPLLPPVEEAPSATAAASSAPASSVMITPADRDRPWFVMPHEVVTTLGDVLTSLQGAARDGDPRGTVAPHATDATAGAIPYLSFQNDNLRRQIPALARHLGPLSFSPWGPPSVDALNLWIGDGRSTSSLHKDPYDNLYAVVRGTKLFYLYPPPDVLWLYERSYPVARYVRHHAAGCPAAAAVAAACTPHCTWSLAPQAAGGGDGGSGSGNMARTRWLTVNPQAAPTAHGDDLPLASRATPYCAAVAAGEVLFLPALWHHQVAQVGLTIAVNWWHDMDYTGPGWAYYNVCRTLSRFTTRGAHDDDAGDDAALAAATLVDT